MRGLMIALSVAALAGVAAAGTVEVGTLRADTAQIGTITPPSAEGGRVLYLPFRENNAGLAFDESGGGHTGTVANCVWTSAGRYAGGAMSFNGSNSSIGFPTAPDFPSWNTYSVSIWFLHNGGGYMGPQYGHKLIDKTSWYHDWHINLRPDVTPLGHIAFVSYEGGTTKSMWDPSNNYADGAWHHVAVIRDGVAGQLWVDGVLKDSIGDMITVYSFSALCVGNSFSGDSYQRISWSGLIDEVRIYDRALSPAEIGQLYQEGALTLSVPVSVAGDLAVGGDLTVEGEANLLGGARSLQPSGNLPSGVHTNAP